MSELNTIEATEAKPVASNGLRNAALAAAGVMAAGALLSKPAQAQTKPSLSFTGSGDFTIPGTGDTKVLNYALALEALEADLYAQALARLTDGNATGTSLNRTIAGLGLPESDVAVAYTIQFGKVELEHRNFLNNALGANSILGTGTNGILRNASFDFKIETLDRTGIVNLLYTVENTGVQAYLGAITSFVTKQFLLIAASIQATEARHTAAIAIVANQLGITPLKDTAPLKGQTTSILGVTNQSGIDGTLTPDQVLAAVSGPNGYIVLPTNTGGSAL